MTDAEQGAGPEPQDAPQEPQQQEGDNRVRVSPAAFDDLADEPGGNGPSLDLVLDIAMPVTVELGRSSMTVRELLSLRTGSVVELERLAGDPIDLYVRGVRFARGEVVVVDNNFGLRITEILNPKSRIKGLGEAVAT
jgi:flagellar motor switch protein FliN/FliY